MRFGKGAGRNLRLSEEYGTRECQQKMSQARQARSMCKAGAKPALSYGTRTTA